MSPNKQLPDDGEYIVACNRDGGCWVERFDNEEPLGALASWFPISEIEYMAARNGTVLVTHRLYISQSISFYGG